MSKILCVTTLLPYPLDMGCKISLYRSLEILSEKHEVDLVCFTDHKENLKYKKELEEVCGKVKIFVKPEVSSRYKNVYVEALKSLLSFKPFYVYRYYSSEAKKYIEKMLERGVYDFLLIDHVKQAQYLPEAKKESWVLKEYDIDHLGRWRAFLKERNLFYKVFFLIESLKFYLFEKRFIFRFDKWIAISDVDKEKLIELGAKENEVYTEKIKMEPMNRFRFEKDKKKILFVGLLSWWPNKEGIEWFLKRVYPLIKKRLGDVEMVVVGDREGYVKDAAERFEGVELTGYVEKVDEYYEDCGVFVVPLRVGSGIRVKILNAMAAGMPVVSSSIGLEGIPARDGREVMVADTVDEFAEKVEKVLIDESLAMELSRNALSFIENEYSEEKARLSVEKVFE